MRQVHLALSALLGLAVVNSACEEAKSPDSVESEESPSQSPMEELQSIPVELNAQVADLTKPIDDVQKVIDQLTSIPKRYGIDAADMVAEPSPAPAETRGSAPTATTGDQVILKDGTTMRGRVVKQAPGTFVMIEAADGTQRTIPWDRVREVVVAPPAKAK